MYCRWIKVSILSVLFLSMFSLTAFAYEKLDLGVNSSRILKLNGVERIAVADPLIADVVVISTTEILLVGKAPGTTSIHVWCSGGKTISYTAQVTARDVAIEREIRGVLGVSDIEVMKSGKTIVLKGKTTDDYQKQRAELIASAYGEKVVNLLEISKPVQVRIEAVILEIDKSKVKNLGFKWGSNTSTPGSFSFGQSNITAIDRTYHPADALNRGFFDTKIATTNPSMIDSIGKMGTFNPINGQIDAMVKEGVARILSQPNMVTLSGNKGSIMVGGEIPIPVANDNGKISFSFKDYGIKLDVEPVVNSEGLISGKITAEVSSIDWNSAHKLSFGGGVSVPPIRKNKAETVIVLASGQSMAVGGLLSSAQSDDIVKIPLLGDLPLIGELFRSKGFSKDQTEMIIIITPTIVDPQTELLTGKSPAMNTFINEATQKGVTAKEDKTAQQGITAKHDKTVQKGIIVKQDKTVQQGIIAKQDKTAQQGITAKQDKTAQKGIIAKTR